ncbi:MAG: hypothetical protein ACOCX5_05865 [Chloroflexota bacterium]
MIESQYNYVAGSRVSSTSVRRRSTVTVLMQASDNMGELVTVAAEQISRCGLLDTVM